MRSPNAPYSCSSQRSHRQLAQGTLEVGGAEEHWKVAEGYKSGVKRLGTAEGLLEGQPDEHPMEKKKERRNCSWRFRDPLEVQGWRRCATAAGQ